MITIWLDKFCKGWDGEAEPEVWHESLDLVEGFSRKFARHDAHFVPYHLEQLENGVWSVIAEAPRLKAASLPALDRFGVRVVFQYGVADIDCFAVHKGDEIEVPESWRRRMREVAALAVPGCVRYDTRGGLRVVWRIARKLSPSEYREHLSRAHAALRTAGLPVDDLLDWQRCYRLPFVLRDGSEQELWADIHEPDVWEPPVPVQVETPGSVWDRITDVQTPFALPQKIEGGSRHTTLCRYAASLRAQNKGREEIEKALAEIDATRCEPPVATDTDGSKELSDILDWACSLPPGPSAEFAARREIVSDGEHVFQRGDSVEVAEWVLHHLELPTKGLGADGGVLPMVSTLGALWTYDPPTGRWVEVERAKVLRLILSASGMPVFLGATKGKPAYGTMKLSFRLANDVYQTVEAMRSVPDFFDHADGGIAFSDRFVRIEGGFVEKHAHSPSFRARNGYDFAWTESPPDRFLEFLRSLWSDRPKAESATFIESYCEWVGVTIAGKQTLMQKAICLIGDGSNGKSKLCNITEAMMPLGTVSHVNPQEMGREYYRVAFAHARLNVASEVPASLIDDDAAAGFKVLITGEVMKARPIRESVITFVPRCGVLVALNGFPRVTDESLGFFRRWLVLQLSRIFSPGEADTIADIDKQIIEAERHRIVCYCLREGAVALARGKYHEAASGIELLREWRSGVDEVEQWLQECSEPNETGTPGPELYNLYRMWCEQCGIKEVKTSHQFFRSLAKRVDKFMTGTSDARQRRYKIAAKRVRLA